MLRSFKQLRVLLDARDQRRLMRLFAVVAFMACLEVVGIASILPFLRLASDANAITSNPWISWAYESIGFSSHRQMLVGTGCVVIAFLSLSNLLGAVSVWMRHRIAWSLAHSVSMRLVRAYRKLPYEFFLQKNSAQLIRKVIDDVNSMVVGVLLAGCQFVSQLLVATVIFALLLWVQPRAAIAAFTLFAGVYVVIYLARRRYLLRLGEARLTANSDRYRGFVEFVSGVKSIRSDRAEDYFMERFEKPSLRFSLINPKVHTTTQLPRYFVETIGFSAVVVLVLSYSKSQNSFGDILPTLTMFAVAGYRLLPAINSAYASIMQVAGNLAAVDSLYADLSAANQQPPSTGSTTLAFKERIRVEKVTYSYAEGNSNVVDNVSFTIPKGSKVAFVGPTGSGKTTLIDILIGLLAPKSGELLADDVPIQPGNLAAWQDMVGYVPQEVFLYDDTLAHNVAFGTVVDMARVRQACQVAQIADFVDELPDGYDTCIGERGARLSGGQRQRLGLARAVYRQPQILVLDEATSALDSKTEDAVVASVYERLPGITVVMIAHRISTVRRCDRLFVMDRGKIVCEGSYEELLESSQLFQELARFT